MEEHKRKTALAYWREKRELTQQALADATGITIRQIQRYEQLETSELSKAKYATIEQLATVLGVNVSDLVRDGEVVQTEDDPSPTAGEHIPDYADKDIALLARNQGHWVVDSLRVSTDISAEDLQEIRSRPDTFKSLMQYLDLEDVSVALWVEELTPVPMSDEDSAILDMEDSNYSDVIISWKKRTAAIADRFDSFMKVKRLNGANNTVSLISVCNMELKPSEREDEKVAYWLLDWANRQAYKYIGDMAGDFRAKLSVFPLLDKLGSFPALQKWTERKKVYKDNIPYFDIFEGCEES